jgi:lipopolysaccharide export system ATP-binding protein
VTDRCYVIREGRVFAYGDRMAILNNADVRRYYIGERFDVGHLLDGRQPHGLPSDRPGPGEVIIDDVDDEPGHPPDGPLIHPRGPS